MTKQHTLTCDKCNGHQVYFKDSSKFMIGLGMLLIPVFGWVLGPYFMIQAKKEGRFLRCRECKNEKYFDRDTYLKMKSTL